MFPILGGETARNTSFFDALTEISDIIAFLGDGCTDIE